MIKAIIKRLLLRIGYRIERVKNSDSLILRPIDAGGVEILADKAFQDSCAMLGANTLLDTPRLANLWMLCRMTDPSGAIAEIGTYRGGGALHLSNCCRERQIVICDPFSPQSFEKLEPQLDQTFHRGDFADHSQEHVGRLLKGRNHLIIPGYFPQSVRAVRELPRLSFVHLDVDVYHATKESLFFLLTQNVLLKKSLIVLDDYNRGASGVNRAAEEIAAKVSGTLVFPMFPGQALVIPKSWYDH